jgi:nicotinamidase-related amidase
MGAPGGLPTQWLAHHLAATSMTSATALVIIDPQAAFVSRLGSFSKALGADEVRPLQRAGHALVQLLTSPIARLPGIVLRSEYTPGQFTHGSLSHALSYLCVPEANIDCHWADGFAPPPHWTVVTKCFESALTSRHFVLAVDSLLTVGVSAFVLGGFLLTSCVKKTAIDLRRHCDPRIEIRIALSITGTRQSKYLSRGADGPPIERAIADLRAMRIRIDEAVAI